MTRVACHATALNIGIIIFIIKMMIKSVITNNRAKLKKFWSWLSSLRSKRFQSSYCAKVRAEAKKGPSFLDEARRETLATQASDLVIAGIGISNFRFLYLLYQFTHCYYDQVSNKTLLKFGWLLRPSPRKRSPPRPLPNERPTPFLLTFQTMFQQIKHTLHIRTWVMI